MTFPINVRQHGSLPVSDIYGLVEEDKFVLFITLGSYIRNFNAEVWCEGGASIVLVSVGPDTHWYDKDGVRFTPKSDLPTEIEFPAGWHLGVSVTKNSMRVIGIKMRDDLDKVCKMYPYKNVRV